ncbi:glycosyltransferase family 9 protein [Arcticibacter sp. MXS-1]|uniref:glycosyltransferase family 9 protein n=1 Tax=Arcticibacter sp. MXS-1 TaxID=3341726 RepID=UPI0035A8D3F5
MIHIAEARKIAVLRANALGDFIFILPALRALRERFPAAEIVLLGRQWHKQYLQNRPGPVDRVIVVPPYQGISEAEGFTPDPAELDRFFTEMQKEEFDIAFQLHGGGRNSNPFILRLGAKLTVGLKTPDAASLDINVPYIYYFSEMLRYLEVVAQVGARTEMLEPEIAVTNEDKALAAEVIKEPAKPIAVIHPGASDRRRHWPAANFARLADELVNRGYAVYVTGMPFESAVLDEVVSSSAQGSQLHKLCGTLSLSGMTGLLDAAELLISNDTGPLHLARAMKTPTLGIYWCGNSITGLPMTTSLHRSLLSFKIDCPLCGLSARKFGTSADPNTCLHDTSFVADVSIEEALETLDELLSYCSQRKSGLQPAEESRAA